MITTSEGDVGDRRLVDAVVRDEADAEAEPAGDLLAPQPRDVVDERGHQLGIVVSHAPQ